jgi:predicted transcriptional regulator
VTEIRSPRADEPRRRANGTLAADLLAILHEAGTPLTPGEVLERLDDDLAYSTVVTILSRLYEKGVLTRSRPGRAFTYAPVADVPGLAARRMHQVLESEPDRATVLARFVGDLSARDEALLRDLLNMAPEAD